MPGVNSEVHQSTSGFALSFRAHKVSPLPPVSFAKITHPQSPHQSSQSPFHKHFECCVHIHSTMSSISEKDHDLAFNLCGTLAPGQIWRSSLLCHTYLSQTLRDSGCCPWIYSSWDTLSGVRLGARIPETLHAPLLFFTTCASVLCITLSSGGSTATFLCT